MTKVAYIHVPKTGGFSIGRFLRNTNQYKCGIGHLTVKEWGVENFPILMTVVRNPFDRMYSVYEYYKTSYKIEGTFEDFILNFKTKYFETKLPFYTHQHFMEGGNFTDILRFENLTEDFNKFCEKYKLTNPGLLKRNSNPTKTPVDDYSTLYTPEMRAVIEDVFKDDLKQFSYSYEGFLASKS